MACDNCRPPFNVSKTGGKTIRKADGTYWHNSHYREGACQTYMQIYKCRECGRNLSERASEE